MSNMKKVLFCFFAVSFLTNTSIAQLSKWQKGVLVDEYIFDTASFPQSHAATIAETPEGIIATWFGGTKEGNKDVCIWTSNLVKNKWTAPKKVADGIINDTLRYACYNPVLFYAPNKELLLFYKIGPNVAGWTGWMMRSKDNGKTWSKSGPINDDKKLQAIQPSILQYKDGRLQILCRSRNTTLNESWSNDGGKTWSEMKASALPNNNSGTDAVTLKDGRQLLVYNHL